MRAVTLSGVRCFASLVRGELGRLTLLVGENSAGKSTFLAATRLMTEIGYPSPNFNQPPFELGAYDDIAHYHGGQGKRVKSFTLGKEFRLPGKSKSKPRTIEVVNAFESMDGQPIWTGIDVTSKPAALQVSLKRRSADSGPFSEYTVSVEHSGTSYRLDHESQRYPEGMPPGLVLESVLFERSDRFARGRGGRSAKSPVLPENVFREAMELIHGAFFFRGGGVPVIASAPIRTRPARTYDRGQLVVDPEGGHIPSLLASLRGKSVSWGPIAAALERFGNASGLFKALEVKEWDGRKSKRGPFALELTMPSQRGRRNLQDVGYGVSQVLPILVEALLAPADTLVLLQQPEVHLHPRAQAELGTFLATVAASERRIRFVIETHSDHFVDRIRREVRKGTLAPSDVSILYFHRVQRSAAIDRVQLNANGEPENPPSDYRDFFLREELAMLGLDL